MALFDTDTGDIHVNEHHRLTGGMAPSEIEAAGFKFERDIDMRTGWVIRSSELVDIGGLPAVLAFGFDRERLRWVSWAFQAAQPSGSEATKGFNDSFLGRELGEDVTDKRQYSWGSISSEIDPHSGQSQIVVFWN